MRLFSGLILGALVMSTVAGQPASKRGLVATLKNNAVADGCGCYFRFRGTSPNVERYIFFSSIENDERVAWMNIGGRDVKLTLQKKEGLKGKEQERVGSRSTARYTAAGITVNSSYTVTKVCDPNDESCESTQYDATFVVRKGAKSQVVKAVGGCGC